MNRCRTSVLKSANRKQGAMGEHLRRQHPPLLLPLEAHPPTYDQRRHYHHLRFNQPLYWSPRPSRLLFDEGCNRGFHPRPVESADRPWHPCQRSLPRPDLDSVDPSDHAIFRARPVYQPDGTSWSAGGGCNLLRLLGQSG